MVSTNLHWVRRSIAKARLTQFQQQQQHQQQHSQDVSVVAEEEEQQEARGVETRDGNSTISSSAIGSDVNPYHQATTTTLSSLFSVSQRQQQRQQQRTQSNRHVAVSSVASSSSSAISNPTTTITTTDNKTWATSNNNNNKTVVPQQTQPPPTTTASSSQSPSIPSRILQDVRHCGLKGQRVNSSLTLFSNSFSVTTPTSVRDVDRITVLEEKIRYLSHSLRVVEAHHQQLQTKQTILETHHQQQQPQYQPNRVFAPLQGGLSNHHSDDNDDDDDDNDEFQEVEQFLDEDYGHDQQEDDDDDEEQQHQEEEEEEDDESPRASLSPSSPSSSSSSANPNEAPRKRSSGPRRSSLSSLNPTSFSFLLSARVCSIPFFTGVASYLLKNAILGLLLFNLLDLGDNHTLGNNNNMIGIPVAVEAIVAVIQVLSMGIAVVTQKHLIDALVLMYQGYSNDMREMFGNRSRRGGRHRRHRHHRRGGGGGHHRRQWLFYLVVLLVDGLFGLSVTFVLVVTSETVLGVLLNFAAVQFVASLDQVVFSLSSLGFLGKANQRETDRVSNTAYRVLRKRRSKAWPWWWHTLGLVTISTIVVGLWATVLVQQLRGTYAPKALMVQFDDEIRPALAPYSGIYRLDIVGAGRFHYRQERAGEGRFAYCPHHGAWTFSIGDTPCGGGTKDSVVLVKSVSTKTRDVTRLVDQPWFVVVATRPGADPETTIQTVPMPNFFLQVPCHTDDDCGRGECVQNRCRCDDGVFGPRCQHDQSDACGELRVDERFANTGGGGARRQLSTRFQQLPNTLLYDRPVYFNSTTQDVILFTGVRWAVTNLVSGLNLTRFSELATLDANQDFFAGTIRSIDLMSDPVLYQTAQDRISTPVGIPWTVPLDETSWLEPTESVTPFRLLCGVCLAETNPCRFNNTCVDGQCQCLNGATGSLCQIAPVGDGKCDVAFNTFAFNYDGGDCCRKTCVGNSLHQCGFVRVGNIPSIDFGFPYCRDPNVVGPCGDSPKPENCYIPNSQPVPSVSGDAVYPTLSDNGRILVLAEPTLNLVRLFDLVGSQWVQRGRTLRGGHSFGTLVAVATPPPTVRNGRNAKVPITLAVLEPGWTRIFEWGESTNDWVEIASLRTPHVTRLDIGLNYHGNRGGGRLRPQQQQQQDSSTIPVLRTLIQVPPPVSARWDNGTLVVTEEGTPQVLVYERRPDNTYAALPFSGIASVGSLSSNGDLVVRDTGAAAASTPVVVWVRDLVRNQTMEFVLPNTTVDERIFAMRIHRVVATDSSWRTNQTIGLSVVTTTSSNNDDESGVLLRYYTVDPFTNTIVQRAVVHADLKNLTAATFSSDGTSVLLTTTAQPDVIVYKPYRLDLARSSWRVGPRRVSLPFSFLWTPLSRLVTMPVSISSGAKSLVDGTTGGKATVWERATPCRRDEVTFRLVIAAANNNNHNPDDLSWSVFEYSEYRGYVKRQEVLFGCEGPCPTSTTTTMASNTIVEEICWPKPSRSCLALSVTARFQSSVHGYAAYMMNGQDDVSLLATDQGSRVSGRIHRISLDNGGGCENNSPPLECDDGASLVFAHSLSNRISSINWFLEREGSSSVLDAGSMVGSDVTSICVASSSRPGCYTLSLQDTTNVFLVEDRTSLWGDYSIFYNDTKIDGGPWKQQLSKVVRFGC